MKGKGLREKWERLDSDSAWRDVTIYDLMTMIGEIMELIDPPRPPCPLKLTEDECANMPERICAINCHNGTVLL